MKYVVVYFEGYVGYHFDENAKVFNDEKEAKKYAKVLNKELSKEHRCTIEDLGDYYEVEAIRG